MSRLRGVFVRVFLGPLEEFVELLLEHLAVGLLGFKLLLKELFAARAFAFQLGDLGRQVFNRRGFTGTVCAMTARVSGSTLRIAWQQGHSTSNIALAMEPW